MPEVVWTPIAESDLDDILFYIAFVDRNPVTGERVYFELRDRVNEHAGPALAGTATSCGARRLALSAAQAMAHFL